MLPVTIPHKGEVLTALTHYWLTEILYQWDNHLIGSEVNTHFNAAYDLQSSYGESFPLERTLVVSKLEMQPYELIFRHHLGGSVWQSYVDTRRVSGIELPAGHSRWQKLDPPLFTPSTKEVEGHDKNITIDEYYAAMGSLARRQISHLREMYEVAYGYAQKCGILILDIKLEVSKDGVVAD